MTQPMGITGPTPHAQAALLQARIERTRQALRADLAHLGHALGHRARAAGRAVGAALIAASILAAAAAVGIVRFLLRRVRRRRWA